MYQSSCERKPGDFMRCIAFHAVAFDRFFPSHGVATTQHRGRLSPQQASMCTQSVCSVSRSETKLLCLKMRHSPDLMVAHHCPIRMLHICSKSLMTILDKTQIPHFVGDIFSI